MIPANPRQHGISASRNWYGAALFLGVLGCFLLQGLWVATDPSRMNHDVAWNQTVGAILLDGGTFGADITDVNPPWIFQAHALVEWLARATGVAPLILWLWFTALLQAAAVSQTRAHLQTLLGDGPWPWIIGAAALTWLLASAGRDLGQRDVLVVGLALPYLSAAAVRATDALPRRGAVAGLLMAVAVLFKAHYLLLPVMVAIWLRRRGVQGWRRPESWGLLCGLGVGGLLLGSFGTVWLSELLAGGARYAAGAEHVPVPLSSVGWVLGAAVVARLSWRASDAAAVGGPLVELLAWSAGLALAVAAIQGRGFSYHLFPAQAFAGLTLLVAVTGRAQLIPKVGGREARILGLVALLPWCLIAASERTSDPSRVDTIRLSHVFAKEVGRGGTVAALSPSVEPLFPAVNFAGARWVGRESCLWQFGVTHDAARLAERPYRYLTLADMTAFERAWVVRTVDRLVARTPQLLVVDISPQRQFLGDTPVDLIRYFSADLRLPTLLQRYQRRPSPLVLKIGADDVRFAIWRRRPAT